MNHLYVCDLEKIIDYVYILINHFNMFSDTDTKSKGENCILATCVVKQETIPGHIISLIKTKGS